MGSKKNLLNKTKRMTAVKKVLDETAGKCASDAVWLKSEKEFIRLSKQYSNLPEEVRRHTQGTIFPAVAVYRVLKAEIPEKAMFIMDEGIKCASERVGRQYAKMTKIPVMRSVFLKIFSFGAKKMFGTSAGFKNIFYKTNTKIMKMDITQCPYSKYCIELGCPELTHIFCSSDIYAYGNLTGIRFTRTQTIGTGGEKCDFLLERY